MATGNPLSGHTAANITSGADGLRDGDHIISPSLTNLYEGVHGNGILLYEDTAYGDSDRNNPQNLPGAISAGAAVNLITVKSFDAVLDGNSVVHQIINVVAAITIIIRQKIRF